MFHDDSRTAVIIAPLEKLQKDKQKLFTAHASAPVTQAKYIRKCDSF